MKPLIDSRNVPSLVRRNLAEWSIPDANRMGETWRNVLADPATATPSIVENGEGPNGIPGYYQVVASGTAGSSSSLSHRTFTPDRIGAGENLAGGVWAWASKPYQGRVLISNSGTTMGAGDYVDMEAETWTRLTWTFSTGLVAPTLIDLAFFTNLTPLGNGDVARIAQPWIGEQGATPEYWSPASTPLARQESDGTMTLWEYGS